MKRMFWLGIGVLTGVVLSRKANTKAQGFTPAGVAANLGDAISELAGAVGAFGADVRAGMSEREGELREVVERANDPGRRSSYSRSTDRVSQSRERRSREAEDGTVRNRRARRAGS
ncbi:hypothetical protein [Allokutzneria albata]|uniref:Secreted protein n=1 Tax=Allokutzneria albata TaxID=211114 RepID=A0A1H0DJP9_ALLAB|nr:hypothetical protein [Allokutzneria albata]SDN70231.1 hypothetical protein SAMN04489726_7842 [Allokutzneria albata]